MKSIRVYCNIKIILQISKLSVGNGPMKIPSATKTSCRPPPPPDPQICGLLKKQREIKEVVRVEISFELPNSMDLASPMFCISVVGFFKKILKKYFFILPHQNNKKA